MHLVFVYGSLKKGYGNHYLLENSECLGNAQTLPEFQMHSLGSYPALVSGDKAYEGELYKVDDETFQRLDWLEGYPDFYIRTKHEIVSSTEEDDLHLNAWIYTLANEEEAKNLPIVDRSSW